MSPTDQDLIAAYKALRKDGMGRSAACRVLMRDHGLTAEEAAAVCWQSVTGGPPPQWKHEDGSPTQAALDWHRRADAEHEEGGER